MIAQWIYNVVVYYGTHINIIYNVYEENETHRWQWEKNIYKSIEKWNAAVMMLTTWNVSLTISIPTGWYCVDAQQLYCEMGWL